MKDTISTMELRQRLGEVLDRVSLRHDEFVVERKGRPLAAIVPVGTLEHLRDAARLHLTEVAARSRTAAPSQREADLLADEAKHATRAVSRRAQRR